MKVISVLIMAKFIPYSSLAKDRRRNYEPFNGKECVATEKIHGANGQLYYSLADDNTETILFGKRTAWVKPEENFFNCHNVLKEHIPMIKELYSHFWGKESGHILRVYGEICGGYMPSELKLGDALPNTKIVQKGAFAIKHPNNLFVVFDICYDDSWCSWDNVVKLCNEFGFIHVPEVSRGNFEDIRETLDINSLVSPFSKILHGDEVALHVRSEGVVFRLVDPIDSSKFDWRIKYKADEMLERPSPKNCKQIDNDLLRFQELTAGYINDNRWDTFLSKHGPDQFIDQNIGKNIGMLIQDALKDIREDHGENYDRFIKRIKGGMTRKARKYIIDYMKTI